MLHHMLRAAAGNRSAYSDEILADSPDIYFRFLETSGTVADNSGTLGAAGDADLFGSPTLAQPSLSGEAGDASILFDGVDDYGLTPTNTGIGTTATSNFTAECLIKFSSTASTAHAFIAIRNSTSSNDGSEFIGIFANFPDVGKIALRSNGTNIAVSGTGYNDGAPHHIWAEKEGSTLRMWIDDVLVGSSTIGPLTGTDPLKVAFAANYTTSVNLSQAFPGTVDEIATYRRILDGARRTARVNILA